MEELEQVASPTLSHVQEAAATADPVDPLNPDMEEGGDSTTPPLADPTAAMQARQDDQAPGSVAAITNELADNADDNDSELEDLDEEQFADFDPNAVNLNIPVQPVAVDADNVNELGTHKRKRTEEEEAARKRKKRERKRDKPSRKQRKAGAAGHDGDDEFVGGEEMDGKRARKSKPGPDGRLVKPAASRRPRSPEINEDDLSPEERRRRALDRKMDEALRTNKPSRRRAGVDLEAMADAELEMMRNKMAKACEADATARARGEIATYKLNLLPEVVELLNRNTLQSQLIDPETNILEAVRFFLEPADQDAALPNYRIQRELFALLQKLPMTKEALVASGIGKVVHFYTKSAQPQPQIKRLAERLVGEWMRVVLKKRKDLRGKEFETRAYDPLQAQRAGGGGGGAAAAGGGGVQAERERQAEKRRKQLQAPVAGNRARVEGGVGTYTIAPVNSVVAAQAGGARRGTGDEQFRRVALRAAGKTGGAGGRR